jgi:hypothetical protein
MPINHHSFVQTANSILEYLRKCKENGHVPDQGMLKEYVYNLMTRRDSQERLNSLYTAYFFRKEAAYLHEFQSLRFDRTANTKVRSWFSVSNKEKTEHIRRVLGVFKITYKEYFTFFPQSKDHDGIYHEIIRFLRTFPELHREFYQLCVQEQDYIQFKTPGSMRYFISHPDSLVVHYLNPHLRHKIRDIVLRVFSHHGLKLKERKHRANSGFDFERNGEFQSHSQLLSKIMAKHIIEHRQDVRKLSTEQMVDWLKKCMIDISKWDERKVHRSL